MGRRRLHDEATATSLLEAAEALVEREGLEALTVRRVADACEVSTRAVYSSLGSKQALVAGLGTRAFDLLGATVASLSVTDDPAADLVRAGTEGFRTFALDHPVLFRVGVQQTALPPETVQAIVPAAERALASLHARLAALQEAGGLRGRSVGDAAWQFHAVCEGLAALELRGIIDPHDAARQWEDALRALVTGWSASPAPTDRPR
jgi:AcrR family transcriptional regulator